MLFPKINKISVHISTMIICDKK